MNELRVWKWLVPAFGMVGLIPVALWVNMFAERNGWAWFGWCNFSVVGGMLFLGIQAWGAFKAYFRRLEVDDFVDSQNAMAISRDVKLFEYARTMHPETVRQLLQLRKIVWRVKAAKPGELADWILDEDPRVRVRFVEHVLKNSKDGKLMPMNGFLSDKSFSFDEAKVISDYEQYRAFHQILINLGMATNAYGNQSGHIIPPWTPGSIAARWGIVMEEEEETPSVGVPTSPPNAKSTNLGEKAALAPTPPHPSTALRTEDVPTDEEVARIKALDTARATLSTKEYLKFCQSK